MEAFEDYYGLLGLSIGASAEEIQKTIRDKARRWRQLEGSPDPKQRRAAEEGQEKLDAAKKVLLNPQSRKQYDAAYDRNMAAKSQQSQQNSSDRDNAGTTQAFIDDAIDYYDQLEFGNALRAALEAYRLDPQNSAVLYLMADCEVQLGKLDDAYFHINQALRLDNTQASYWAVLGAVDDMRGEYGKAEKAFERAATLEPDNSYYGGRVAWAKSDQGQYQDALYLAQALLAKYPNDDYTKLMYSNIVIAYIEGVVASNQDGTFSFTNPKQVEVATHLLDQVKQLGPSKQPEVNNEIARISDMVAWSSKRHFNSADIGFCIKRAIIFVILDSILIAFAGIWGVIVFFAGVVFAVWYVLNNVVPYGWKTNKDSHTPDFNLTGVHA